MDSGELKNNKNTADEIADMIRKIDSNLRNLRIENAILKEKLKQAEFERDEWRKVAER